MTNEDVTVLRQLGASVYLTARQKEALGRVLSALSPVVVAGERTVRLRAFAGVKTASVELLEDQRHALLGPCGAE